MKDNRELQNVIDELLADFGKAQPNSQEIKGAKGCEVAGREQRPTGGLFGEAVSSRGFL